MPAPVVSRKASIDDNLKIAIRKLKKGKRWKKVIQELNAKGINVTESNLRNILRGAGNGATQWEVSYDTYIALTGKEPPLTITYETPELAQRIAHWHTVMFGMKRGEYAKRVLYEIQARKGKRHGLNHTPYFAYLVLFNNRVKSIDSLVTEVVADFFNYGIDNQKLRQFGGTSSERRGGIVEALRESSQPQFDSLSDLESFITYLEENDTGAKRLDRVDGKSAIELADRLIKATSQTFYRLTGRHRKYFQQGKTFAAQKYYEMERHLRKLEDEQRAPGITSLSQILRNQLAKSLGENAELADYLIDISGEDRPFLIEASKNYGTKPFIRHMLPVYLAIKREYGFPPKAQKALASFKHNAEVQDEFAANAGERLWAYKGLLDHNRAIALPRAEAYARNAKIARTREDRLKSEEARKEMLRTMEVTAQGVKSWLKEAAENMGASYARGR